MFKNQNKGDTIFVDQENRVNPDKKNYFRTNTC